MKHLATILMVMVCATGLAWGDVAIGQRWSGFVHLPMARPGEPAKAQPPQALRSQAELDGFVSTIPTKMIQMTQPAPPSDDPLLAKPAIDFKKWTAIVVYSDFIFTKPTVERVVMKDGTAFVTVSRKTPEHAHEMSYPLGIGRYQMVLVPRFDGKVVEAK